MKLIRLWFVLLAVLIGPVAVLAQQMPTPTGVKPGVVEATALDPESNYCHLRFPAIDPQTLGGTPALQAADTGDMIDFYGPCDHDPLGAEEVTNQLSQQASDRGFNDGGDGD